MPDKKKIWEHPWGYAEGFVIAMGVLLVGFALQIFVGNIHTQVYRYPVNLLIGVIFTTGLFFLYFSAKNNKIIYWFATVKATVPALIVSVALIIIMGITPQFSGAMAEHKGAHKLFSIWGWHNITTSWTFVFLCFYMLFIIGITILKRTRQPFKTQDIGFYLNHIGIYVALLGGMLGSADLQRMKMTVEQGNVEWRATADDGKIYELPVAVQLDTFKIEEYPPKIVIINSNTGKVQPEKRPETYLFYGTGKTAHLAGYTIQLLEYLPQAGVVQDSLNFRYAPFIMDGAASAIKIRVSGADVTTPIEGWISNGSYMFPYHVVDINKNHSVAMAMPEVKKYVSQVSVFTKKGHSKKANIEVNKPLSVENWMIYQLSYDEEKGKYATTSVFELVKDPYLGVVYTGILMLMAGSVFLFMTGAKNKHV